MIRSVTALVVASAWLAQATAQPFATTSGEFAVSESGSATFNVPIHVPPGAGDLAPKLALSYNSLAGNGPLGVGWSLSGLSSITRCPRTQAQDGARGAVRFDANDRYCMDGQRLIAISGPDGGNNIEYRTERESFSRVVSFGNAGGGPSYFRVWTKAGQVLEYGNTPDSKIEAQGQSAVRVWALNRLADKAGNYFTVSYVEDAGHGEYYPGRIDYSGNVQTGSAPSHSVQFSYVTRPDAVALYLAGATIKTTKLLGSITTYAGSAPARTYTLSYTTGAASGRSRLSSIQACIPATGACDPATTFTVSDGSIAFADAQGRELASGNWGSFTNYARLAGDLNGDGITDLVWAHNGGGTGLYAYSALGKGDGTFLPVQGGQLHLPSEGFGTSEDYDKVLVDTNGDGLADVLWIYSGAGGLGAITALSKGDGTFHPAQGSTLHTGNFSPHNAYSRLVADINGDDIPDLIWSYSGVAGLHAYTAIGKGDGSFHGATGAQLDAGNYGSLDLYARRTGDVNGDGVPDLVWMYSGSTGAYAYVALGRRDGTFSAPQFTLFDGGNWGATSSYAKLIGDVNGDGIADLVFAHNAAASGLYAYSALGKGDGTFLPLRGGEVHPPSSAFTTSEDYDKLLADVNGDGLLDVVWSYSGAGGLSAVAALGRGDGTFHRPQGRTLFTGNFSPYNAYSRLLGDVNGDGVPDLLWSHSGSGGVHAYAAQVTLPRTDHVVEFRNGLGASTAVAYVPLTLPSKYAKDSGGSYPVLNLRPAQYVVGSATSSGSGSSWTTDYSYGGLKAEQGTGRGLLGFRWIQAMQIETGITTRTEYRQDWPYTGMPTLVRKTLAGAGNGGLLGETSRSYQCLGTTSTTDPVLNANPAACSVAPGRRYFSYAVQMAESQFDLAGATLPTITTGYSYDIWGNPSQITVGTSGGGTRTTTNTFAPPDTTGWIHGRLLRSTVTSTVP